MTNKFLHNMEAHWENDRKDRKVDKQNNTCDHRTMTITEEQKRE